MASGDGAWTALGVDDVDRVVAWASALAADLGPSPTVDVRRFAETGGMDPVVVVTVRGPERDADLFVFPSGDVELGCATEGGAIQEHAVVRDQDGMDDVLATFRRMATGSTMDDGLGGQSPRSTRDEPGSD